MGYFVTSMKDESNFRSRSIYSIFNRKPLASERSMDFYFVTCVQQRILEVSANLKYIGAMVLMAKADACLVLEFSSI